eukprot:scaffold1299_cov246-Pinguiococcus_pyrenoidosus.AAC.10
MACSDVMLCAIQAASISVKTASRRSFSFSAPAVFPSASRSLMVLVATSRSSGRSSLRRLCRTRCNGVLTSWADKKTIAFATVSMLTPSSARVTSSTLLASSAPAAPKAPTSV